MQSTKTSKASKSTHSTPLRSKNSVKGPEQPLVRIIHLDCGTGGDCTVLYTDTQFIVIDGGKGDTGTRLTTLLKLLLDAGKEPLAFIVSHFDLDHYYGLFKAVRNICEDQDTTDLLETLTLLTPADVNVLNGISKAGKNDMENSSHVFIICRDLKRDAENYQIDIDYSAPTSQTFENGIKLQLQSQRSQYAPTTCNQNNASSLQWILKDSKNTRKIKTTYYTGGDSEAGPLTADIMKLDHHGSTVTPTNSAKAALKNASHWVIMGAGRVHKHPGENLLDSAATKNPWILMTQHHFDDSFLLNPGVRVGRVSKQWGDIGIALYQNKKILVNISAEQHLLTDETQSIPVSLKISNQLDPGMHKLLTTMRGTGKCPDEMRGLRTEDLKVAEVLECSVPGCLEEASRVHISIESNDLIVCKKHKDREKESQLKQLKLKKMAEKEQDRKNEGLNKKRKNSYDLSDDEDWEEEDWEEEEMEEEDEEEERPAKKRKPKKMKTPANSREPFGKID